MATRHDLYVAAIQADELFHAALVRAFGKNACNRRYDVDETDWPQECRIACWNYQSASAAWIATLSADRMGAVRFSCCNATQLTIGTEASRNEAIEAAVAFVAANPGLDAVQLVEAGFDASKNGLWFADRAGRIVWRNGAWFPIGGVN